jgi:ribosomal protein S18 acetylase RimI-like enzyme
MAAALARSRLAAKRVAGPLATRLDRDLYQIAELVELCFAERLDSSGRSAVREMKAVGRLGLLLAPLALLDSAFGMGIALGHVWRTGSRVVGNVSLYRSGAHPFLGRGWLIANVAVHPEHRRQGIAHALMIHTLEMARRYGGRWVTLQVEADNPGAIALYEGLGFARFETLEQWEALRVSAQLADAGEPGWEVRPRSDGEIAAEMDLIFDRARRGAMAWTRTIERFDIHDPLSVLGAMPGGSQVAHLVMPDPRSPGRLAAAAWVKTGGWQQNQISLFIDPDVESVEVRQALLRHILHRGDVQYSKTRLETTGGDETISKALQMSGFRKVRSLVQMRMGLSGS